MVQEAVQRTELAAGVQARNGDFVSLRTNKDHALRKHLQAICANLGLEAEIPRSISISHFDTYESLLMSGLDTRVMALPESSARFYASGPYSSYAAIPFRGEGECLDVRVFFPSDKKDEELIGLLVSACSECDSC